MTVTAILTAGGVGSRMQKDVPKQFITVNDIPIIIYTLQQFQKSEYVDKIVIACLKEWQPILRAYSKEFNISKLQTIVEGGETGIDSIHNAFNGLSDDSDNDIVKFHINTAPRWNNGKGEEINETKEIQDVLKKLRERAGN